MKNPDLITACWWFARQHLKKVFWAQERTTKEGTEFRIGMGVDGVKGSQTTGWCPTVKGTAEEMRYILGEAVKK